MSPFRTLTFLALAIHIVIGDWSAPRVCMQPTNPGNCLAAIPGFSYDPLSGKCEAFTYTGCGGNHNRFRTRADCIKSCACHMPPGMMPCTTRPAWFYNREKGCCERYPNGGCPGQGNAFGSHHECKELCAGTTSGAVLPLGSNWGSLETVQYDLERRGSPQEYAVSFRVPKTVWLHNENINLNKMNPNVRNFMKIIQTSGKTQVPGIQTKGHWHEMSRNIPVGGTMTRTVTGGMVPVGGIVGSRSVTSTGGGMVPMGGGMSRMVSTGGAMVPVGGGMMTTGGRMVSTGGGMVPESGGMFGGFSGMQSSGGMESFPVVSDGMATGQEMSGFASTAGMGGMDGMGGMGGMGAGGIDDIHFPGSPNDIIDAHSTSYHPDAFGAAAAGAVGGGVGGGGMGSGIFSRSSSSPFGGQGGGMSMTSGSSSGSIPVGRGMGQGSAGMGMVSGSASGSGIQDVHFPGSQNDIIDAHTGTFHPGGFGSLGGATASVGGSSPLSAGVNRGGGVSMASGSSSMGVPSGGGFRSGGVASRSGFSSSAGGSPSSGMGGSGIISRGSLSPHPGLSGGGFSGGMRSDFGDMVGASLV